MEEQTAWVLALQIVALCSIAAALLLYLGRNLACKRHGGGCGLCVGSAGSGSAGDETDDEVFSDGDGDGELGGGGVVRLGRRGRVGGGRSVLVTSCDGSLGMQIALHLDRLGFRVFAGFRDVEGSACRALSAAIAAAATSPTLRILSPLDVTREDHLHEAVQFVRKHLPAGEEGLWAVVNTNGVCCRGRLESQDGSAWDTMLRVNLVGTLKAARTFLPLLRSKKGRLINLGASEAGAALGTGRRSVGRSASMLASAAITRPRKEAIAMGYSSSGSSVGGQSSSGGLVAYTSARFAVEGASAALRLEVAPLGVDVVTLRPIAMRPESLFAAPKIPATFFGSKQLVIAMDAEDSSESALGDKGGTEATNNMAERIQMRRQLERYVAVLPQRALRSFDEALLSKSPKESYELLGCAARPISKPKQKNTSNSTKTNWFGSLFTWNMIPSQENIKEKKTKQITMAA